jgi:two-component system, OmpR family, sensor kinase
MSIRLRLTLWYNGLLVVVLVAFSALFYWVLTANLNAAVDRTLDHFTVETHLSLGHTTDGSWLEHTAAINLDSLSVNDFSSPGVYVQVVDDQGRILAVSSNLRGGQLPVQLEVIQDGLAGRSTTTTMAAGGGDRVRVATTPVFVQGKVVGLVQVGQSLHTLDDITQQVRLLLAAGMVLAISLAGLMGWVLAGSALRPVSGMATSARGILSAQDLSRRIPVRDPRDELGMVAGAFNAMLLRLQTSFQSQQQFVADSSHELRTPLTIIRGNADLLQRGGGDPTQAGSLDAIRLETERMAAIIDDLLLLAQLDAPPSARRQLVDLDAILADVYSTLQPVAAERILCLGTVEALQVHGDAGRLRRMVLNLSENALKYAPPGGRVVLSCQVAAASPHARDGAIGYAAVSVSDTGPGIPPEHLPHIFERFYRVDKARSRSMGGTGLGLAIVKGIAESHDGWVSVESQPGAGTTFTVWLPLVA